MKGLRSLGGSPYTDKIGSNTSTRATAEDFIPATHPRETTAEARAQAISRSSAEAEQAAVAVLDHNSRRPGHGAISRARVTRAGLVFRIERIDALHDDVGIQIFLLVFVRREKRDNINIDGKKMEKPSRMAPHSGWVCRR